MTAMACFRLQEAVFAALAAATSLSALVTGVYDEAPTGASYPYAAMGGTNLQPNDLKDRDGASISFDIILWSKEPSQLEVKELMAEVDRVLDKAALGVVGYSLVSLRLQSAAVTRQWNEDGSLYRGRLTYAALVYAS
ncbi:DUF3168 domain-containing protein [Kordiimonas pumila]|uniref:DUF3168 domain-containing protein n=1 Tax=Kordiimonas pumila TaxID=2161677 RepID=A0ABV7D3A3_9PROT|nr:DUF3168 domain-containing protein [Kordiimonas pumila]